MASCWRMSGLTIASRYDLTADKAIGPAYPTHESLHLLSICILVMRNGFVVIGKPALASPANFNAELGKKLVYEGGFDGQYS
jgi:hypothetical protein